MLPLKFFQHNDVVHLAQELIGCILVRKTTTGVIKARITETEAYRHYDDLACHAANSHRTPRNFPMFEKGGRTYVYLCYGIHNLMNIVTNKKDKADAVLIRAVEPIKGLSIILRNRNHDQIQVSTTAGPGNLTKALSITRELNNQPLNNPQLFVEEKQGSPKLVASTRIGIGYAGSDELLPWRFYDASTKFITRR